MIKKIVLTGGPCAGKTTALAKIEQDLTEKGYRVFIVSESATELIKSGISPDIKNGVSLYEFQKIIMLYQLQKEEFYEKIAKDFPSDKKVIIYDRGLMDNKSYITDLEFKDILEDTSRKLNINLTETDIINRYDMVIHLVTSAEGNAKNYTLENNAARTETAEEARIQDKKTMDCWVMHDNLHIVDNYQEFNDKLNRVLNVIHNCLGNPNSIKKERKFLINKINFDTILENIRYVETNIEKYYIESYMNILYENHEVRLRKTTYKDGINYYYSFYTKESNGVKKIISERKLTEREFKDILYHSEVISKINKKRYSFIYNKQYFKLDLFEDFSLLEVIQMEDDKLLDIPKGITMLEEVTDNNNYQNISIGNYKTKKYSKIN